MESISLKLEPNFLKAMERAIIKNNYSTKTEFIRSAIRDKINELEKEEMLKRVDKLFASSKHKTSDEKLHSAGEEVFKQLEKKFSSK
jgi:metal-responsive CopG/Arc/MetJ family transcriptional regulator